MLPIKNNFQINLFSNDFSHINTTNSNKEKESNDFAIFSKNNDLIELFEPFQTDEDDEKFIENLDEYNFIKDYLLFLKFDEKKIYNTCSYSTKSI